jgi:hypothetical protein
MTLEAKHNKIKFAKRGILIDNMLLGKWILDIFGQAFDGHGLTC